MADQHVNDQYENFPYPARDPADEKDRLITGSPSHLLEINHYVFGGNRRFDEPFRALVAGGGTGDAAIMLAQQLADAGDEGQVVYVDLSWASREIAERRAAVRGLTNITFETLSILELPGAGLGEFDYIDCCGVLHHLAEPEAGLSALTAILADGGGLGLMLYGELGRTGVYPVQDMMKMLAAEDSPRDRLTLGRRLLQALPDTNWLKRNPFVGDHLSGGDAGLYDLLLHSRDRAYRVPEIAALMASAGLAVTRFIEPVRYDPASYIKDPQIAKRLADHTPIERAAFSELLAGNMRTHVFYAVPEARAATAVAEIRDDAVPHLHDLDGPTFAKSYKPGTAMSAEIDGIKFRRPLPPLAGAILSRIDGRSNLAAIHQSLQSSNPSLDRDGFQRQFSELFRVLNGFGKIYLSGP